MTDHSLKPWIVCLSAALFFFYEFIQMGMFNSLTPDIMQSFNITATQVSNLSATYFYADVTFLLFAGILTDRFSVRQIILFSLALCILATFAFAGAHSLLLAGLSHFVAGIGNAFCFLSCVKLSSRWFDSRHLASVMGVIVTIGMMGGVVAQAPLALLIKAIGWRQALVVDALLGILILLLIWCYVEDYPSDAPIETKAEQSLPIRRSLSFVVKNKQNWLAGLYASLLNLPIMLLGELWGQAYLTRVHQIPQLKASYITSMIFLGTIIGSPLVGWFSDHLGYRRLPMLLGGILSLVSIFIIMWLSYPSFNLLMWLFFSLGFFTSTQIIAYPMIAESNPKNLTGTATGLAAILIMGGGAVFQPLFGWLMDLHAVAGQVQGVAQYTVSDFARGMNILPIAFIIGTLACFFMRETCCLPYKSS